MNKLINTLLKKDPLSNPPIWIMRQAGRYLPEYLNVRSNVKSFLDLCYNPELASEVTLQPIRRFGFDAAIIFSDILVIPDALGVKVEFVKNEGPKLQKISTETDLKSLKINNITNHLQPVFETIKVTRSSLDSDKDLIGFSGAPWTLACYMIEGGGSKSFELTRKTAIQNEEFFTQLIDVLTKSIIEYLSQQIKSGVNVVKLFDSWAGILPPDQLRKWVINPAKKITSELKKIHPQTPVICFPRGIGFMYEEFSKTVGSEGLAIDQNVELGWAKKNLGDQVLQGNLDNFLLAFGSESEIKSKVLEIMQTFEGHHFIFNLGHGILPETPIKNVELIVDLVRG